MSAEDETGNTQIEWRDTATNGEVERTINVKDILAVAHSQVEMGRKSDKNVPAQMGTGNISVGRKNRQKENWATEDLMGSQVQECSRRKVVMGRRKRERMG